MCAIESPFRWQVCAWVCVFILERCISLIYIYIRISNSHWVHFNLLTCMLDQFVLRPYSQMNMEMHTFVCCDMWYALDISIPISMYHSISLCGPFERINKSVLHPSLLQITRWGIWASPSTAAAPSTDRNWAFWPWVPPHWLWASWWPNCFRFRPELRYEFHRQ